MKTLVTVVLVSLLAGCANFKPPVRSIQDGYFTSSRSPSLKFKVPSNWKLDKKDSQSGYEDYTKGGESGGHFGTNITREYFKFIEKEKKSSQTNKVIVIEFNRLEGQYGRFIDDFHNTDFLSPGKEILSDGNRYHTAYDLGKMDKNSNVNNNCYIRKMFSRSVGNKKNSIFISIYKTNISCQTDFKTNYSEVITQYKPELDSVVNDIILR